MTRPGAVIWITGLPGAGKTTLSHVLCARLREHGAAVVRLDGDTFRAVMGDLGYSREDRLENARRIGRMCKLLADQGITVVCATVSLFHGCHAWNREHLPGYREVFLRARPETLARRDQKGLHSGGGGDVLGVDQAFEEPLEPHLVVESDDDGEAPESAAARILAMLGSRA